MAALGGRWVMGHTGVLSWVRAVRGDGSVGHKGWVVGCVWRYRWVFWAAGLRMNAVGTCGYLWMH